MSIKLTIKEQVSERYEPLDIINNICIRFRLKCIKMLKEGLTEENELLLPMKEGDTVPFSKKFLETIGRNQNAVVGLYLADRLLNIVREIKEEIKMRDEGDTAPF